MSLDNQLKNCLVAQSPYSIHQDALLKKILSYDFTTQKSIIDKEPEIINQSDSKTKNTLLFYSVRNDNYPLAEYLIEKNANINLQNILGETPFHKAVENGSHKMINFLLDKGADPNIQQEFGETPMHIAASKGDYKVIKLLLLYHANPAILTTEGYLAEDYANKRGNQKCVDILAKALNQIEVSDLSSPLRGIKEQFNSDQNELNDTNTPRNESTKKKKTVEMKANKMYPNIALSNPSDDDLKTDCDNFRYNGLNNYNRTPNNRARADNMRIMNSDRKINKHNRDNYNDNDDNLKGEDSEDNILMRYKLPLEKIATNNDDTYSNWNNHSSRVNQPFSTLISMNESFKDLSKEQIIFYSEKNDIIEEVYARQSSIRVSLKKKNTLKNSKYVQNTYQDELEYLEDQEHNYHQLETIHDKNNANNNFSTTEQLDIPPGVIESINEKELYDYLKKIDMEQYSDLLIKQGFDDLSILLSQMKTKKGITDTNLKDVGITKVGHRARILIKLQIDAEAFEPKINEGNAFYYSNKKISDYSSNDNLKSIYQWLHNIKLNAYYFNFYSNGYHSIDLLYLQTLSKYIHHHITTLINRNPLTEEILEQDIKIPKLGYRLRIINKLIEGN